MKDWVVRTQLGLTTQVRVIGDGTRMFGFRLEWLPAFVAVLDVPDEVTLDGDHVCSGEEAVLLLLYRLRCTGPRVLCCYPLPSERPHRRFLLICFCLIALPITHHGSWALGVSAVPQ